MNDLAANHGEPTTLRVLSIQSDILGHRTYSESMRHCFSQFDDIDLAAFWYHEGRTFRDRVIYKLARLAVPLLRDNLDFQRARAEWSLGWMGRHAAKRKLADRQYDLIHFHTQVHAIGAASLMKAIPTVVSCDMTAFQIARMFTARHPATYRPGIAMERKVFRAAAHIVTWSECARRSVIEEHGIANDKVTAISPGARLDTFAEPIFAEHERLQILFVGGDFTRKGGWDLLKVFSQHLADRADLHLVTNDAVESTAPNVFVHRNISAYSNQWHQRFREADVFVMPSYEEGFGLVFQEAAGYGLALVGTRIGAIPEMIFEGENGFLIKPGDQKALQEKLRLLVDDRTELMRMRKRNRQIAQDKFDAAKNFRRLADLFRAVAGVSREDGSQRSFSEFAPKGRQADEASQRGVTG